MKNFLNKYPWIRIIVGTVLLALGVVVMVLALNGSGDGLTKTICILAAIFCFILGLFIVTISLISDARSKLALSIVAGGAIIGLGVALCFDGAASVLTFVISCVIPFALIGIGSALLIDGIILACTKEAVSQWVMTLILAGISLTVGIVFACNLANDTAITTLYTILGIVIAAVGIVEVVFGIIETVRAKKAGKNVVPEKKTKKAKKNEVVVK